MFLVPQSSPGFEGGRVQQGCDACGGYRPRAWQRWSDSLARLAWAHTFALSERGWQRDEAFARLCGWKAGQLRQLLGSAGVIQLGNQHFLSGGHAVGQANSQLARLLASHLAGWLVS